MLNSKKLRILCLHGMAQNAILFRKKTKSLLRDIEDIAELGLDHYELDYSKRSFVIRLQCTYKHLILFLTQSMGL